MKSHPPNDDITLTPVSSTADLESQVRQLTSAVNQLISAYNQATTELTQMGQRLAELEVQLAAQNYGNWNEQGFVTFDALNAWSGSEYIVSAGNLVVASLSSAGAVIAASFSTTGSVTAASGVFGSLSATSAIVGSLVITGNFTVGGTFAMNSLNVATSATIGTTLAVGGNLLVGGNVNATGTLRGASATITGTLQAKTIYCSTLTATVFNISTLTVSDIEIGSFSQGANYIYATATVSDGSLFIGAVGDVAIGHKVGGNFIPQLVLPSGTGTTFFTAEAGPLQIEDGELILGGTSPISIYEDSGSAVVTANELIFGDEGAVSLSWDGTALILYAGDAAEISLETDLLRWGVSSSIEWIVDEDGLTLGLPTSGKLFADRFQGEYYASDGTQGVSGTYGANGNASPPVEGLSFLDGLCTGGSLTGGGAGGGIEDVVDETKSVRSNGAWWPVAAELEALIASWTGSDSITQVGTITSGTWQATPITSAYLEDEYELAFSEGETTEYFRGDKTWATLNAAAVADFVDALAAALEEWPGSAAIAEVGTVTSGEWTATPIADEYLEEEYEFSLEVPNDGSTYLRGDRVWADLDKAAVGLANVENTALSTWSGSATITTLGAILTCASLVTQGAINATGSGGYIHADTFITAAGVLTGLGGVYSGAVVQAGTRFEVYPSSYGQTVTIAGLVFTGGILTSSSSANICTDAVGSAWQVRSVGAWHNLNDWTGSTAIVTIGTLATLTVTGSLYTQNISSGGSANITVYATTLNVNCPIVSTGLVQATGFRIDVNNVGADYNSGGIVFKKGLYLSGSFPGLPTTGGTWYAAYGSTWTDLAGWHPSYLQPSTNYRTVNGTLALTYNCGSVLSFANGLLWAAQAGTSSQFLRGDWVWATPTATPPNGFSVSSATITNLYCTNINGAAYPPTGSGSDPTFNSVTTRVLYFT